MSLPEKQEVLEIINDMYKNKEHDKIITTLLKVPEAPDEPELAYILARAFIDLSISKGVNMLDAAEMLLLRHSEQKSSDPLWNYQAARASYFGKHYIDAVKHLNAALENSSPDGCDFPQRNEAKTLLKICKNDIKPVSYTAEQRRLVIEHIRKSFGEIDSFITDDKSLGLSVDIAVIKPTEKRRYFILSTVGMGAYIQPSDDPNNLLFNRTELIMHLPPDWDPFGNDINDSLLVNMLHTLATLPFERSTWLSYGQIFSLPHTLTPDTEMTSITLIAVQNCSKRAYICRMPENINVVFYQVFPLYSEEAAYKKIHGINALLEKMTGLNHIIDLGRENVLPGYTPEKDTPLRRKEIDYSYILDSVGIFCAVSERIIYDGCRVGYMKRLSPSELAPDDPNDSGWIFLAGDESREYLSQPHHISVHRLNTVCNIDETIIPFICGPYGTELMRKKSGELCEVNSSADTSAEKPPPS